MNVIRKFFLISGLSLVFGIAAALTVFFILVSPAHLKKRIIAEIYVQTGLQAEINGPVRWKMSPLLEVSLGDVQFKQFLNFDKNAIVYAKELNVGLAFRPLLSRQVKIQGIELKKFSLIVNLPSVNNLPIKASGDLQVDWTKRTLNISPLKIEKGGLQAEGQIFVKNILEEPVFTGYLKSQEIDFTPELKAVKLHISFDVSSLTKISGKLLAEQLNLNRTKMKRFSTQFNFQDNQLQLNEINATLASGKLNGQAIIKNLAALPRSELTATLKHVELRELLQSGILQGPADLRVRLTTQGTTEAMVLSNLNGSLKLTAFDGALNHVDLLKQAHIARQILEINADSQSENLTHFSVLTASGTVTNGLFSNNDFLLQAQNLQASGRGTINLINKEIDYHLLVKAKGELLHQNYGLSVPLKVKGQLNKPRVKIDLKQLNFSILKAL